jgi:hypothetical protein
MTSAICPHRYFDLKLGQFGQLEQALTQIDAVKMSSVKQYA